MLLYYIRNGNDLLRTHISASETGSVVRTNAHTHDFFSITATIMYNII
jgi:hypothetical protein